MFRVINYNVPICGGLGFSNDQKLCCIIRNDTVDIQHGCTTKLHGFYKTNYFLHINIYGLLVMI